MAGCGRGILGIEGGGGDGARLQRRRVSAEVKTVSRPRDGILHFEWQIQIEEKGAISKENLAITSHAGLHISAHLLHFGCSRTSRIVADSFRGFGPAVM